MGLTEFRGHVFGHLYACAEMLFKEDSLEKPARKLLFSIASFVPPLGTSCLSPTTLIQHDHVWQIKCSCAENSFLKQKSMYFCLNEVG